MIKNYLVYLIIFVLVCFFNVTFLYAGLEVNPNNYEYWNDKGYNLSKEKKLHKEAIKAYIRAIEIDPTQYYAWLNKGYSLNELGKFEEAIKAIEKSLAINPKEGWCNKGYALRSLGRYEESIVAYNKDIKVKPNKSRTYNSKGFALQKLKRDDEAVKSFKKAIALDPKNIMAILNLSEYLILLEKPTQADEILTMSEKLCTTTEKKIIWCVLKIVVQKILGKKFTLIEEELNRLLNKAHNKLRWSFDELNGWIEITKQPDETKYFIKLLIIKVQ